MRALHLTLLVLVPLILVPAPAVAQQAETSTRGPADDVETLRERGRTWVEAARREDAAALARLYTSDAVFMPPGRPELAGRAKIRSLFQTQFERFEADYEFEIREIVVSGDWAFRRGAYTVRATLPDGSERTVRDKFLDVWRREADGRWRIARDIWNRNSPRGGDGGS